MIEEYLNKTIGLACVAKGGASDFTRNLPLYLRTSFKFSILEIDGQDFLLLEPVDETIMQVSRVVKFARQIRNGTGLPTLVSFSMLDSVRRRTLIANRENFIVPDKQIYIPFLRMYLNESAAVRPVADRTALSPSAQLLLLYHLQKQSLEGRPFKDVAEALGYSKKTIFVVVAELRRLSLCEAEQADERSKVMRFNKNGRELWDDVLPLTISPVLKVWRIDEKRLPSGLPLFASYDTALAHYTFIAQSSLASFAVDKKAFLERPEEMRSFLHPEEGDIRLEVWKYDPATLADGRFVDKLSMSLCYKDSCDERVEGELERMINQMPWLESTN